MSEGGGMDTSSNNDPLDLESLDLESLFGALTAVESAIPELLASIKPILHHLVSPASVQGSEDEASGIGAREAVDKYMTLLDKIQFVLRQTVYYLLETRAAPQTLRPPPVNAIPTPFASTLPEVTSASTNSTTANGTDSEKSTSTEAELGLYATRLEARFLSEMVDALQRLRENAQKERQSEDRLGNTMSVDPQPP
ncbi:hypothetical protein BD324DRAFT_638027 [Kockovaella imperatae]|uniref:Mediator of RNA polymerase II transcription subunit 11 n=1 Tax=Kockovaella imperatae TaxID=4999 RepID=A0A1Y1U7M5_9TREE|nr:hypothetical protein BD324DRAFT_638027 [Kockovaella imperatae]ORX34012.1 hypothetical protein BD324DRAFT_638027 [Kockovaella imperatae]